MPKGVQKSAFSKSKKRAIILDALQIAAAQYDAAANSFHDQDLLERARVQAAEARAVAQEIEKGE